MSILLLVFFFFSSKNIKDKNTKNWRTRMPTQRSAQLPGKDFKKRKKMILGLYRPGRKSMVKLYREVTRGATAKGARETRTSR